MSLSSHCNYDPPDLFNRVDYLSCVSGGACAGASLSACASEPGQTQHANDRVDLLSVTSSTSHPPPHATNRGSDEGCDDGCSIIDNVLHQLRRQGETKSPCSALLIFQLAMMIAAMVTVMPLIAAATATLAAASVTDIIGDTLHALLTDSFHPLQAAVVVVFFGPIWAGLCCLISALAMHEHNMQGAGTGAPASRLVHMPQWTALPKALSVSAAGQMSALCMKLMAALSCVIVLMVLEQQLLSRTLMDEVLIIAIWMAWSVVCIRTLLFCNGRAGVREEAMLANLKAALCFCILWLTSRACVGYVMQRGDSMAYSTACMWFAVMVMLQDVLMAGVSLLFRMRLRSIFLSNAHCQPAHLARYVANRTPTQHKRPILTNMLVSALGLRGALCVCRACSVPAPGRALCQSLPRRAS